MTKPPLIVKFVVTALTGVALASAASGAFAQESEAVATDNGINLETPSVFSDRQLDGRLDLRAFGGAEDLTYTSLGLGVGLGRGWEAGLRASFADTRQRALSGAGGAIRHGGSDVETLAKYAFPKAGKSRIAAYAGIGFPDTPARKSSVLTLGLTEEMPLGNRAQLILNPRAALLSSNTIVGFGVGVRVRLADHLSLVGDYTPIVSGDNTHNTTNGAFRSHDVYGAALRYQSKGGSVKVDLGYTNAVGFTTGSSLTPGLDGAGAFYFSISARR